LALWLDPTEDGGLELKPEIDLKAIENIIAEYPDALSDILMVSCNVALLILRVLQRFDVHPKLNDMRKINWNTVPYGMKVEQALRR
jgi:hypothetical protein